MILIYEQAGASFNILTNESNEKYKPRDKFAQLMSILIETNAYTVSHTVLQNAPTEILEKQMATFTLENTENLMRNDR